MKKAYWFWTLPVLIILLQYIFTINSISQIRYEELAESVRNVYWLEKGLIYDGVSSNVGWYGTILFVYKTFGFSLFGAKFFRLFLSLISLICLAAICKRHLNIKAAAVSLIAIGLSPTLLYFNTLQAQFGIDVQYIFIILFLLSTLSFNQVGISIFKQFLAWSLAMIAWMSYPTFAFYLPALGIFYLWQLFRQVKIKEINIIAINFLFSLAGFVLPLFLAFTYIKNSNFLIFDPNNKSGIFRGAGSINPDLGLFFNNISRLFNDLFIQSGSYYFEIKSVEFSQIYPVLAVVTVLSVGIILAVKNSKVRLPAILTWITLLLTFFIANFTSDPTTGAGLRRNTPILTSFYALYGLTWFYLLGHKWQGIQMRNILMAALLLLPLHHILVIPANLFNLSTPSPYEYSHIFKAAGNPEKSFQLLVQNLQREDLKLACKDPDGDLVTCRYVEGYASVAGACLWNNLSCREILGYDDKTSRFIPLTTKLWEDYYFEH